MKKVVGVLLALVILGNLVMPAMAAEVGATNDVKPACPACSQNVVAIEVKGLEKSFILAKALENEDLKKVLKILAKKGYNLDLIKAKAGELIGSTEIRKGVVIPMESESGEAMLIYILANGRAKVGAVEILKAGELKKMVLYYIDADGAVKTLTVKGSSRCWNCIWQCTGQCIVDQCAPQTPGLCSFCYPLLQSCLLVPGPENPACEGALICYGSFAVGCFCWCTYHCNKDLGQCP